MANLEVLIAGADLVTGYGHGEKALADGLFAGRHAISEITRFDTGSFPCHLGATVPGTPTAATAEALLAMLNPPPRHTAQFLASTVGEIDQLPSKGGVCTVQSLLQKTAQKFQSRDVRSISGACASFNIAAARAAADIRSGRRDHVLLVGFDVVSEFAFSGFASLQALSPTPARSYDAFRDGLTLGDAAGWVLLASPEYVRTQKLQAAARLSGWGMTTDAEHITAPNPEGRELERAIRLAMLDRQPHEIGAVIGHGTGTRYNDAMELRALNRIFPHGIPLSSTKGGAGHTLGAAGLVQMVAALSCLQRGELFPQTNLSTPDPQALQYVSTNRQLLQAPRVLSLNAGFGGLNAALMLEAL